MHNLKIFIRTTLFGGFLIVLPIVILLMVLNWMFDAMTGYIRPITNLLIETTRTNEFVASFFAFVLIILIFFLVGLLVKTEMGKLSFELFEKKFLSKIFGYRIIKETVLQIFGEEKNLFKAVALVKLFGNETLMTAFVTDEHPDGSYTVFIPSGPAPTAGFVYHVKREQITIVDIPVDQALRTILSLGGGSKKIMEKYKLASQ
ncbi:transporter [hydrocarbon metagenome]|uniref:Transporter n=1 Tax=hydrocarbon metagenome TaxID=938273 RepID=A0A0W8G101_9ZZZZ